MPLLECRTAALLSATSLALHGRSTRSGRLLSQAGAEPFYLQHQFELAWPLLHCGTGAPGLAWPGRIDDLFAINIVKAIFGSLPWDAKLYAASPHTFRRQWNAVMKRLGIPHRAADSGQPPEYCGAAELPTSTSRPRNIQMFAWRGRWSKTRTLESYLKK